MRRDVVIAGAVVVIAAGAWLALRGDGPRVRRARGRSVAIVSRTTATAADENHDAAPSLSARAAELLLSRRRADELREKLRALLADAGPLMQDDPPPPSAPSAFPEMPSLVPGNAAKDPLRKYIQSRVREDFFPLAKECYGQLLEQHPQAAGKVILSFRIVGDTKVGGVVDEAKIEKESDLKDPAFSLCMTESMMSVTFDAPPGPKRELTVTYPIELSPGEEPDAGPDAG